MPMSVRGTLWMQNIITVTYREGNIMNTQEQFDIGRTSAYDAMEIISNKVEKRDPVPSMAGFLQAALMACHGMAPDQEAADMLINQCAEWAKNEVYGEQKT